MPTEEELRAENDRLKAENESLKKPSRGQMSLKVSEKGALSVYGLGRFPVTLYREQWEKLLAMSDQIRDFIQQNDQALKKKEMSRGVAVITGASSGIGAELAKLCAADGYDLILIARREDLLQQLAGDL